MQFPLRILLFNFNCYKFMYTSWELQCEFIIILLWISSSLETHIKTPFIFINSAIYGEHFQTQLSFLFSKQKPFNICRLVCGIYAFKQITLFFSKNFSKKQKKYFLYFRTAPSMVKIVKLSFKIIAWHICLQIFHHKTDNMSFRTQVWHHYPDISLY